MHQELLGDGAQGDAAEVAWPFVGPVGKHGSIGKVVTLSWKTVTGMSMVLSKWI